MPPLPLQLQPQQLATQSDTTASSAIDAGAFQEFNTDFERAITNILQGRWDEVIDSMTWGAINLTGTFVSNALTALLAFLILYAAYRAIGSALTQLLNRSPRIDPGLQSLFVKTYRVIACVLIGVIVLGQFGVDTTGLLAGLSIVGIAVGFAARDSLENYISGITILIDKPFRVGDNIEIGDQFGEVHEITLRSTRIRTVRNEVVVLPNSQMITEPLVNHTLRNTLRVDVPFGIAYKESPAEARDLLLALVVEDERILKKPAPSVVVRELGDSSVNMTLRFYLRNPQSELSLRWEYTEKVFEALREADVEIPFPHLQLHIDGAKAFNDAPLM